jgi:DNA mismatch repair protein MutL
MIFTFVNHRSVRDRLLARAVSQAYSTLLPRGRHPAVALFIEMRPEDVDVNVHPMKTEVRFKRSNSVFEVVYHALRDRLSDQTSAELVEHQPHSSMDALPENPAPGTAASAMQQPLSAQALSTLRLVSDGGVPRPSEQRALGLGFGKSDTGLQTCDSSAAQPGSSVDNFSRSKPVPIYSNLRVLGQLFAGYVALESDEGLVLVDQHAAHERVTFEKLRAELRNGGVKVQARLVPEVVELSPARAAQVNAALPRLAALGFDAELFGPASLLLKGTPAVFGPSAGSKLLSDMIESMAEGDWARRGEEAFENLLKQLACHGSVRVGRSLEDSEIHALLAELDQTEFKTNCPHGRPVHIAFPRGQIERMFRR